MKSSSASCSLFGNASKQASKQLQQQQQQQQPIASVAIP
jgi:hypothetical protein